MEKIITTKRLMLRTWKEEDFEPFAQMNADPTVMRYFPSPLSRDESAQMFERIKAKIEERGWGLWAVSPLEGGEPMGFIGLNAVDKSTLNAPFSPAVEIGWRLRQEFWGQGYATEGAMGCLKYAFETLSLGEIVSFTAVQNQPSRRVMEKLGMHHHPKDDFDHPKIALGHPLKRHVLYRLTNKEFLKLEEVKLNS